MRLSGVSVEMAGRVLVGPVDLNVGSGEWVGLIGPNGSGKTSLLRAVIGAVAHSGVIEVNGGPPRNRLGRDMAWMPQRPELPPEMAVGDYVLLGRTPHLSYLGVEGRSDREAAVRALRLLDLAEFAERTLSTLSGGEVQRVVLARALAQEAPMLVLDEPISALDPGHALEAMELIDRLRRSEGLTVVTALHDLTLASQFCDRLALLSEGRLVAHGPPREVLTQANLVPHYGAGVEVWEGPGSSVVVVPVRHNEPEE